MCMQIACEEQHKKSLCAAVQRTEFTAGIVSATSHNIYGEVNSCNRNVSDFAIQID